MVWINRLFVGFTFVAFLLVGTANACGLPPQPGPAARYSDAREHIHGSVLIFEGIAWGSPEDDMQRNLLDWAERSWVYEIDGYPVAFRVLRVWKGEADRMVIVDSLNPEILGTSCFEPNMRLFVDGERYLVIAGRDLNGNYFSHYGDEVGLIEELGGSPEEVWRNEREESDLTDQAELNEWELSRQALRDDWFHGLGTYKAVLQQMVDDGVLPEPYRPGPV